MAHIEVEPTTAPHDDVISQFRAVWLEEQRQNTDNYGATAPSPRTTNTDEVSETSDVSTWLREISELEVENFDDEASLEAAFKHANQNYVFGDVVVCLRFQFNWCDHRLLS